MKFTEYILRGDGKMPVDEAYSMEHTSRRILLPSGGATGQLFAASMTTGLTTAPQLSAPSLTGATAGTPLSTASPGVTIPV